MKRLLFLTPGNNIEPLGDALDIVRPETSQAFEVKSLLLYQFTDNHLSMEELHREASASDVVLFDIRVGGKIPDVLRRVRAANPEITFVPLMGGSMEILSLCRMGSFNFDRVAERSGGTVNFRRIQQITNMIDKLGAILPVGSLGHARNWVQVIRYWSAGGADNLANLLRLVLRSYTETKTTKPGPPVERPTHFLSHPDEDRPFTSVTAYLTAHPFDENLPTVAVLHYGGLHREASVVGLRALMQGFQGQANVLPIASDGVQSLDAVRKFLLDKNAPKIDAIVNLMWFRLNGGPMGGEANETLDALQTLGVPYHVPVTFYDREIERWLESAQGLSPVETYATVVIPELDGALSPIPVFGQERGESDGFQTIAARPIHDRVERLVRRVMAWIELGGKPRAERRVALIVYDYPPGPGHIGNASYLDVQESVSILLASLAEKGYVVGEVPEAPLRAFIKDGLHNEAHRGRWSGERLSPEHYRAYFQTLPDEARRKVEAVFGPPPGTILADDAGLRIPGRWFGHIFLGLQPARIPGGDATSTHDRDLPPHHQYLAFYEYLRASGVDAVVHVGTHGTAEFTPGKEIGLSETCFPDILQGDIPQLYLYTISNPSEASIAKRRWQAALVSHHTSDFVPAELYGEYQAILDDLERLREAGTSEELSARIRVKAAELDLPADDFDELEDELRSLQQAAIPDGLHVFGRAKEGVSLVRYLTQLFRRRIGGVTVADLIGDDSGERLESLAKAYVTSGQLPQEINRATDKRTAHLLDDTLRSIVSTFLADNELAALHRGLDGLFLEPGLMGDALRSPDVYPTGRNGCAFDPTRIPFADAIERGAKLGRELMERHRHKRSHYPKTVGLVLWGFETARSGGETIGQLLYLIGARPKAKPGWLPSFEPIPADELDRPRVDVYLMICGFFRDMFPTLVRDLDELMLEIAALDEEAAINPMRAKTGDTDPLDAARIFGPAPGEYGTGLPSVVESSEWKSEDELGYAFETAMSHAYGATVHGEAAPAAFQSLLESTETVSQVIDGEEYKIGDLDHYYEFLGGATRAVANRRGEKPDVLVGDTARNDVRISEASQEIRRCSTTRLLNPNWIDRMLAHDLHGAKNIEERVTNLVGLGGTVGVEPKLFDRVFERFIEDEDLYRRLKENNPHATFTMTRRMGEAFDRGMWSASEEQLNLLKQRLLALDAELEE